MGGCDLILMSPPYADARTYGAGVNWRMDDYQRLGDAVKPALKPGAHCLMVLDAPVREWRKGYGTERGFLPWQVMLDWAERVGLRVPDRMAYGRMGSVGAFPGRFRNDWEPLLWFQRHDGGSGFVASEALVVPGNSAGRNGTRKGDEAERRAKTGRLDIRFPGTLWSYGGVGHEFSDGVDHPARFCSAFAEDAVRCFCPPGGLVCDPFSGSGTTAVAAVRHERRFFGGDLLDRPSDGKPWADVGMERARRHQ